MESLASLYAWYRAHLALFVSLCSIIGLLGGALSGHLGWTAVVVAIVALVHPSPVGALTTTAVVAPPASKL